MKRYEIGVTFAPGGMSPLHDALRQLRALDVEAPHEEAAEHYAAQIVAALERTADAGSRAR